MPVQGPYDRLVRSEQEAVQANKAVFAKDCDERFIRHRVHEYTGQWDKHLLVSGSYGRNAFSYLAKRSFADTVIQDHTVSLFIAHA